MLNALDDKLKALPYLLFLLNRDGFQAIIKEISKRLRLMRPEHRGMMVIEKTRLLPLLRQEVLTYEESRWHIGVSSLIRPVRICTTMKELSTQLLKL